MIQGETVDEIFTFLCIELIEPSKKNLLLKKNTLKKKFTLQKKNYF